LAASIAALNPLLENFERISKVVVMKENWTIENGFMTPSLKVKRNQVEKVLQSFYPQWFHHPEKVLWQ
jgi:long-chain acyl-CoA synthetase